MDFSNGAGQQSGSDLIPNGTLVWAYLEVRGVKTSQAGGEYLDVELTIDAGQPYQSRKIWEMIGNPMHPGNSDGYRQMGQMTIARILEAGRNAGPHNPAGYQINNWPDLTGLRVPIKVGIKKGTGGFEDKNRVAEWLTPNPQSGSGHKDFIKLTTQGASAPPVTMQRPAAPAMSFGQPAQTAPARVQGFGGQPGGGFGGQPAQGFQQPAQTLGNAQPAAGGWSAPAPAGSATPATVSRSEPAPGGWLAQANAGR